MIRPPYSSFSVLNAPQESQCQVILDTAGLSIYKMETASPGFNSKTCFLISSLPVVTLIEAFSSSHLFPYYPSRFSRPNTTKLQPTRWWLLKRRKICRWSNMSPTRLISLMSILLKRPMSLLMMPCKRRGSWERSIGIWFRSYHYSTCFLF